MKDSVSKKQKVSLAKGKREVVKILEGGGVPHSRAVSIVNRNFKFLER